jgi:membrane protein YqaA with SNARE-associated domain
MSLHMPRPSSVRPPTTGGKPGRWTERLARCAVLHGARRRALLGLAGASVGDFFVPALPTQTSVMALGLLQPQRAAWIALAFATAAALGAAVLAWLLAGVSGYAAQFDAQQGAETWAWVSDRARTYGVWAVLLASIFPTPPRLLTAATLLAGAGAMPVVGAVFLGKLIWFGVFLGLLTRAPGVLARVPVLGRSLERFARFRHDVLAAQAAPP